MIDNSYNTNTTSTTSESSDPSATGFTSSTTMQLTHPKIPTPANLSLNPILTLIVAAARQSLGIGYRGSLPWPGLKGEIGYFARVTRRLPSSSAPTISDTDTSSTTRKRRRRNVVIMGRKTWTSIPERFRPLNGRTNVVLTRQGSGAVLGDMRKIEKEDGDAAVLVAGSLGQALDLLAAAAAAAAAAAKSPNSTIDDRTTQTWPSSISQPSSIPPPGHIFIIGGSSLYHEALNLPHAKRVLMTKVNKVKGNSTTESKEPAEPPEHEHENENDSNVSVFDFECDTFFPLDLDDPEAEKLGWRKRSREELEAFTGESFGSGVDGKANGDDNGGSSGSGNVGNTQELSGTRMREGDIEYEFCLYER